MAPHIWICIPSAFPIFHAVTIRPITEHPLHPRPPRSIVTFFFFFFFFFFFSLPLSVIITGLVCFSSPTFPLGTSRATLSDARYLSIERVVESASILFFRPIASDFGSCATSAQLRFTGISVPQELRISPIFPPLARTGGISLLGSSRNLGKIGKSWDRGSPNLATISCLPALDRWFLRVQIAQVTPLGLEFHQAQIRLMRPIHA